MNNEINEDEDDTLFQQEMDQVQPIKSNNKISHNVQPRKAASSQNPTSQTDFSEGDNFSDFLLDDCPDKLNFSRNGLQKTLLKKLRLGKLTVENHLDLHGETVDEARQILFQYIAECSELSMRCAIVVHGKGYSSPNNKPIIKACVNHWLKQADCVLAFCSALPADGGTGAVYILFKNNSIG